MFTGHIHPDTQSALALLETFHSGFKIFTSLLSVRVGDEVQFVLASVFSEGAQWLCSRYWLENYTDTTQYKLCPTSVLFCVLVCSPKPFFHSEKGTKNSLSQQGFLLLAADKIIHLFFFQLTASHSAPWEAEEMQEYKTHSVASVKWCPCHSQERS